MADSDGHGRSNSRIWCGSHGYSHRWVFDSDYYDSMVNRFGSWLPTSTVRAGIELSYVAVCWMLLAVGWGTAWIYLFLVLTVPSSFPVFYLSAIAYGGLFAFEGGESVNLALWIVTPIAQIALARLVLRRNG